MKKKGDSFVIEYKGREYILGHSDIKELIKSNYKLALEITEMGEKQRRVYYSNLVLMLSIFIVILMSMVFYINYYPVFSYLNNEQFLTGLIKLAYGG